jgi:predicted nuclease of predicted toxin-antitoxin system
MHFLFDEMMPFRLAKGLEILDADNEVGKPLVHSFTHMTEHYKPGADDPDIVRLAKKLNAIVVSEDDDYKNITATCGLIKKLRIGYILFQLPKKIGSTYDDKVLAFIKAWPELKQKLKGEKPPYMFVINRNGKVDKHEKFRR